MSLHHNLYKWWIIEYTIQPCENETLVISLSQEHVQIKNRQVTRLKKGYMPFFCINLSNTSIIKPNMIHCVSKSLLGSQHHPAFIGKQSMIDNKKHAARTCSLTHPCSTSSYMSLSKETCATTLLSARGQRFLCIHNCHLGFFFH